MLKYFIHFQGHFKWDNNFLHVSMNGPNINLSFEKKLNQLPN